MTATRFGAWLPTRRAFITGGGSGLGLAFATQLAEAGWTLGLLDRDSERLDEARSALMVAGARAVHPYVADVTDESSFTAAIKGFIAAEGGLDLMVNNAGVAVAGSIAATSAEDWRWALGINVVGVALGCRLALPVMQAQDRGLIINIASAAGFVSPPDMGAYNASKAAVIALTETLSGELAGSGVRTLVAMPGFFPTQLLDTMRAPPDALAVARRLMDKSGYTAESAARDILAAADRGDLYAVLPRPYVTMWRLKRYFPAWFLRRLAAQRQRAAVRRARGGGSTART